MSARAAKRSVVCTLHVLMLFLVMNVYSDEAFKQLFTGGKYADALKYAEDKLPIAERDAATWAMLGIANEDQGFVEKALACYMVAMRNDEKNYEAQLGAARVYNKLNQPESAMTMAKKAIAIKETGEASWEFAKAAIALNKAADAKSALEKVVETDKANIVAAKELGIIHFNAKDYKKAIPAMRSVYDAKADGELALKLGRAYKSVNVPDSAAFFFNESLKDPKSAKLETSIDLARIYYQTEKFAEAAKQFSEINQEKLSADDLYKTAISIEKSSPDDKEKAAKFYEAAMVKYGTSTSKDALKAKEMTGRWKLQKKAFKDALAIFTNIQKADPNGKTVPDIFILLADANDGLGDRLKAIQMLERVTASNKDNIDAFARLAELYTKEKQADKAQAIYEKLVTVQPNNPKVYLALGENAFKAKKYEDALRHFQKSFTLDQTSRAAEGMMQSAWELKRYDLALDAAETALHKDPKLREPKVTLAKIHIINSNWAAAIQVIEELVKLEPNNKTFWKNLASCYEKSNNPDKLAEADKAIINLDKKDVTSRTRYAKYALSKGDDKTALATYKELAVLTPSNADVFKNLYEISVKLGNQNDAVTYLKKYTAIKPQDAAASKTLGDILFDKKDSTGALTAYQAALTADPGIKGLYKKYAVLMMSRKGQEKELLTVLSNAVKAGEADEEIYSTLGEIHQKNKAYPQAIEMYTKALQLKPQNFEALASLAFCQEKAGKISDAIISYEQAVAMSGTAVKEMKALGDLYWQQNKKDQAVGAYKKYVEKAPTDAKTIRTIGDFEYDKKNYPEAVKYYGMVTGAGSKTADFMLRYGDAVYKANNLKKATEIFKAIAAANPKNPEPYKTLYEIAKKDSNNAAAAEYLKQYTALKPNDATALKLLGDNYYELKNNQGALTAYRAVLKSDSTAKGFHKRYVELVNQSGTPDDKIKALSGAVAAGEAEPQMYSQLGNLYKAAGNCQKAIPNIEKASQADPKATDLLLSLAECQAKTGAIDKAILNYEQALAMMPNAVKEHKALGDLYTQQKKTEPAIRSYKKYLELTTDNSIAKLVAENSLAAKNYTDAIKYFGMITGEDAKSVPMLTAYGKACLEGQNNEKAIEIYRKLATLTPQNPDVFRALYDLSMRAGSKDDALQYLKSYTALRGGDAGAQKTLGDMLYDRKDNAAALNAYRAALKADPAIKGIYARYAELLMASGGKDSEMIAVLNGAIASGEADVKMYTRLGDIYTKRAEAIQPTKKTPNVTARKQEGYANACKMYEKASQLDPKDNVLIAKLADCQANAGNANAAILSYEQAVAMNASASKEYKVLGDLYASQNKNDPAIKNYKKYLEKNSDNVLARKVGEFSFQQKNYADAVKYYGMVSGADAAKADVLKPYGESAYQLKDDARAYQIYRKLSTLLPNDATVFKRLYELAGRAGTKDEALAYLKKYTSLKTNDATAQKTLGDMLYERKDNAGALNAYRTALKADPAIKGIFARFAELLMNNGGTEAEITTVLNSAIAANEADVKMYVRLGDIYMKQSNFVKAGQMYEKASQLDPKNAALLTNLAECQAKAGNASAAIMTYEQAIAMNPAANREYKSLGDLYMQQKRTESAVTNYKKYLEKGKDDKIAKLVGEAAYNAKNYPEAVKYLGMISGTEGSNAKYLQMYGEACYQSKDDARAFQVYKQLAAVTPTDASVYKKLYELAGRAGTKEEVLLYLKKYTSLNATDASALKTLGDMLYVNKDLTGSLSAYRAALKADPSIKGIYSRYTELLLKNKGTEAEIVTAFNGAIGAGEADVSMYKQLGEIYYKQKNFVKAAQMYEKASQIDKKDATLLTLLADCQAKAGNASAAILTYEQAIAMNPAASKEYKSLGDMYMQQKREDAAIKNYKKYLEKNADNKLARQIGAFSMKEKNYPEAVRYYGLVTGADATSVDFLKAYAEASYAAKDDFKSYQIYKQLAQQTPNDASVFKKLSEISKRAGTKDEVLLYLKKYTSLVPNDAAAQKQLGDMLYEKKDGPGAIAAYRAVIKADPAAKGFYAKYAELVMASGNDSEIVTALSGAIAAGEADVKMYTRLGDIYVKRAEAIIVNKKNPKTAVRKQENYDKACKMFEKASQLDPKNNVLITKLAESQVKAGNANAAILTYEQAIAMNPKASAEYKALGDLYMKQSKTDQAVKAYKKYLEKNADNTIAKLIGSHSFKQNNYPEAVKYLALVTGADAATKEHLKLYGEACYLAKDDFRAYQILKQLSTLTPNDPDVFEKLYDVAGRAGTKDEVLTYLKKLLTLKPNDAKGQRTLGDMLFETKDNAGALNAYRAALKADPKITGIYKRYATLVMASGGDIEKVKALEGAIAANEADASMLATLAGIYKKQNQLVKAIDLYNKASKADPKNIQLLSELAESQMKNGNIAEATMTYEQVVVVNPAASKEYKMLGDLYVKQKKMEPAVKSYKKYLEKNASDNAIAMVVGEDAYKAKNYPEALRYFGMITGNDAKKTEILQMYADAAYQAQDNPKALRVYQELSTLTPKDPVVFKRLYEISLKAGASEQALVNLKKYVVLKPDDADAQAKLGDLLYDRKDDQNALVAYRNAIKANPSIKGVYKKYVELSMRYGTPDDKAKVLSAAIAAGEGDSRMYVQLGDIYKAAGKYQNAIPVYEKASQLDPKNGAILSSLALCQLKTGNLSQASISYEQAIAMNPNANKEYKQLGDLYMQQKKTSSAISAYKRYLEKGNADAEIALIVAKNAYNAKNYQEAFKFFAYAKSNTTAEYHLQYGLSAVEVKDYKVAISELEKIRRTKAVVQSRDVAYKALALAYEKSGDIKTAAEVLNAYVRLPGVKDPDAAYQRAVVYETINAAQAVTMYEENAVKYPKDYRNFQKLGIYYARQPNATVKATKALEKCVQLVDTIGLVWLELGTLYGKQSREQDMLNAYRKFIEVDPTNAEACARIGEILLTRKMTDDAMVFLEMANSLKENDPKIMTLLARGYIMTKRKSEAAKLLEKVVKLSKGDIDDDLRRVLADVYMESGDFDKAANEYKALLAKKKTNVILSKYAEALIGMGKLSDAAKAVEEVKASEPENLDAHMALGKIKVAQKKYDEAIETYKEVLYINQNYAPALCERANVYMIQGKYEWAKTFYTRTLKANPKNAIAHLGLARIAKNAKDYTGYTDHLEKARKLDPNNKEILDELKSVKR